MSVTIAGLDWLWLVVIWVAGDIGYHIVMDVGRLICGRYRKVTPPPSIIEPPDDVIDGYHRHEPGK
jgi:hypothetical protein